MWVSADISEDSQPWIALSWSAPVEIGLLEVIFDDEVNEDLINLHHHRTAPEVMPALVRDARLEVHDGEAWREVARTEDNRARRWSVPMRDRVMTDRVRVTVEDTNGAPTARIVAVRTYES